mmetsp:Transcript_21564/g.30200  ORF Transcript_21564/g.30200 Transcript_21564/m.30200 type:complete len:90 (+) Transcript_21564:113-382(+)
MSSKLSNCCFTACGLIRNLLITLSCAKGLAALGPNRVETRPLLLLQILWLETMLDGTFTLARDAVFAKNPVLANAGSARNRTREEARAG